VTLVVGPEGGISEAEFELLESKGFQRVRLGKSVLRTSSAGPAAMAALQFASGLWD
jgi:16S rRNA (uracil1498-N3)-methyltransferase